MSGGRRIRYELMYFVDGHTQERWLLEWALEWFDRPEVTTIDVDRRTTAAGETVLVAVEFVASSPSAVDVERHRGLLERLHEKTGCLMVSPCRSDRTCRHG